jgi:hypothetical protein
VIARTHRFKTPTLAIISLDGRKIPVTIPIGSTVEAVGTDGQRQSLVEVSWEGKMVTMFMTDLRERSEVVTAKVMTA